MTKWMDPRLGAALAGLLGVLGVAAGAFGAHSLRGAIDARSLEIWGTAASYQQLHAVALLAVAVWATREPGPFKRAAMLLFTIGVLFFSGSLYALALGGPRTLGAVAPLGGLSMMGAWLCVAIAGLRRQARA